MSSKLAGPFIIFFIVVGLATLSPMFVERFKTKPLAEYNTINEFSLIDTSGDVFSSNILDNNVTIVNFFFTSCQGPCPLLTANMANIEKYFRSHENVRLVSITVDPLTDTPQVLKEYANKFGADETKWHFLTGELEDIKDIAVNSFKVAVTEDANIHSTKIILLDKKGVIRGYYTGIDAKEVANLKKDVRQLL
jgi:protein SCO1